MGLDSEDTVSTFRPPPFVEVNVADGKLRRFAAGTKASFAIHRINSRSEAAEMSNPYSFITAVKEGEEAVEFGPDAELVSYGEGWKLQAVQDVKFVKSSQLASTSYNGGSKVEAKDEMKAISQPVRKEFNPADYYPGGKLPEHSPPKDGWAYFWDMSCVVGLIFLGCAFWVYLLENQFFLGA